MLMNELPALDLQPAHWSPEAEAGVIGGLLMAGAEAYDLVADVVTADSFLAPLLATAFETAERMVLAGQVVDVVSVHDAMRGVQAEGVLQQLHDCAQSYVGQRVLRRHAEIVAAKASGRALALAAAEITGIAADEQAPVGDRIASAQARLEAVAAPAAKAEPVPVGHYVAGFIDRLQDMADGKVEPGIPTRIPTLDAMLGGGLKPGKQIILAARPSVGKSSLGQQICLNVAQQGHAAAFFSMEMSGEELTDRAVANLGRVKLDGMATGRLEEDEWGRVAEAIESMRNLPLFLGEQPAMTLGDIVARARALKRKHGLKLLVIDYLQLCGSGKGDSSRHHQIEEISRGLKSLSKQLGLTIITLSQLNREVEKRASGKPALSDLKESGAIEEDADVVMMLYRVQPHLIGCAVPKNRQGRTGEVALHFEGQYQRWSESTEILSATAPKRSNYTNEF